MNQQDDITTEIIENLIDTIENPVLPPLAPQMKCAAFTNKKGDLLIAHEEPLPSRLLWVEYDRPLQMFSLIHKEGRIQDLGVEMTQDMLNTLHSGKVIQVAHIKQKKVQSAQKATLIIRDY